MTELKIHDSHVGLLGDIVGSRLAGSRRALHRAVEKALVTVNAAVPAVAELRITTGDEFQGRYSTLGAALEAALRVRLELLPEIEVRIGFGRGTVEVLDARSGVEDGPLWWAAREAVEAVEREAQRPSMRARRTAYRSSEPDAVAPAVEAALMTTDQLIAGLSERSVRLLHGLLDPHITQAELATVEGISASAVSQRIRVDGIGLLLESHTLMKELP